MAVRRLLVTLLALVHTAVHASTEVTLGEGFSLSSPCTTSSDCLSGSICSRHYNRCLTFTPPQGHSLLGESSPVPSLGEDPSLEEILTIGREIESFARATNCGNEDIFSWNCTSCSTSMVQQGFQTAFLVTNPTWDTLAYTGYNTESKTIVVSFRGTKGFMDGILDVVFFQTPASDLKGCDGCMVEEGFLFAYHTLSDPLLDSVAALTAALGDYKIIVTGHSLGGGMASLFAVNVVTEFGLTPELFTFAQVRVGNKEYVKFLEEHINIRYRFVHRFDLVPHLPPLFMNFYQHGPEVWQQVDGTYKMCPGGEDGDCSNSTLMRTPSDHCTYLDEAICACDAPKAP